MRHGEKTGGVNSSSIMNLAMLHDLFTRREMQIYNQVDSAR